jgi:hypothetical protein
MEEKLNDKKRIQKVSRMGGTYIREQFHVLQNHGERA